MGNLCQAEPLQLHSQQSHSQHTLQDAFFQKYPALKHTFKLCRLQIPSNWHINPRLVTQIPGQGHYLGKRNTNLRSGYGIMLYEWKEQALYYVGSWRGNCKEGLGIMLDSHGSYYKGEWLADEPNGYGEYYQTSSARYYKGKWANGKKEGLGEQGFADGTKFVGNFKHDLKHGFGKLLFPATACYFEGTFQRDRIVGTGKQRGPDCLYTGPWADGLMHGTGRCSYYDGEGKVEEEYVGQFERGLKHGYGEYHWANGSVYKGLWKNGTIVQRGLFVIAQ